MGASCGWLFFSAQAYGVFPAPAGMVVAARLLSSLAFFFALLPEQDARFSAREKWVPGKGKTLVSADTVGAPIWSAPGFLV